MDDIQVINRLELKLRLLIHSFTCSSFNMLLTAWRQRSILLLKLCGASTIYYLYINK